MADGRRLIRSALILGVMAFVGVFDSRAQTTDEPKTNGCPKIVVNGPQGVVGPGQLAIFEVSMTPNTNSNLTFSWNVNQGQVNEGQSTNRIGVRMLLEMAGTTLVVGVKIGGLPDNCPNSASDSLPFTYHPGRRLLEEFSVPIGSIDSKKLKMAAIEIEENRNDQMYIIEYIPAGAGRTVIKRKLGLVLDHLTRILKVDRSRVTIVVGKSADGRPMTKIYRVPPGADNPIP